MTNTVLCGSVSYNRIVFRKKVCRLGFNPTETIEMAEKRVA